LAIITVGHDDRVADVAAREYHHVGTVRDELSFDDLVLDIDMI
jgi:hypothetical protein